MFIAQRCLCLLRYFCAVIQHIRSCTRADIICSTDFYRNSQKITHLKTVVIIEFTVAFLFILCYNSDDTTNFLEA